MGISRVRVGGSAKCRGITYRQSITGACRWLQTIALPARGAVCGGRYAARKRLPSRVGLGAFSQVLGRRTGPRWTLANASRFG